MQNKCLSLHRPPTLIKVSLFSVLAVNRECYYEHLHRGVDLSVTKAIPYLETEKLGNSFFSDSERRIEKK